eukprot:CAMPEP_0197021758 /NCGR_PEP_ID=MMETSP1384-20130603/2689_1 /TAXON_ID=29189 /ORGANISM="Ammonia sp." /LENGTH=1232 /DNA_ID=CAMNT_0042449663 /DNA_START=24 /DNA_END=3722 /DNA_ORIENTATION=+
MGNATEAQYQHLEVETFEDVEIKNGRNYDCVLVFDIGSAEKDWKAPTDGSQIQYEYLKLLDPADLERRKELFPQHGADFSASRAKEKDFYKNERKLVIKALTKLHVKVKHISAMGKEFEQEKNLKFYYIGIGERTARKFAHKIEYELELDPQAAISYLQLMDEPLAKATVSDEEDSKSCLEVHWKNIFIKYDQDVAPEIYKPHDVLDEGDEKEGFEDSLFRIRDRLALINEMVCQDVELGGCGIYVPMLAQKDHCIVDFYPLHTLEQLEDILSKLFSWKALTYNVLSLPLEEIRTYFGEYIGIYFAYLQFMTVYFVPITVIGLVIQGMQWGEGTILVSGIEYFALFVVAWSVCFPILWQRKEFHWAQKWGTLRFDFKERPRPEFMGEYRRSNVTGAMEEYFPHAIRNTRRLITFSVVATFLIALFGSVVAVILLRVYVSETNIDYGTYYISVANALVIMFFNNIYGIFAEKLNEWENYKTETEYENNLIIKIFIFRFINSYATLYYIAFFRRWEPDEVLACTAEECMEDLAAQLGTIFITQLTVSNAVELGSLAVARAVKGAVVTYFTDDEKDSVYNQYSSEIYERTFDDYCEILVSFGYATLFVISFPLAPFAAFVGLIVEARIDGYKLCKLTRRPFPRQADDVGTWQLAMEVMGWAVLVTNLCIICFSAENLDFSFLGLSDSYFEETLTALIIFAVLFILVSVLNFCVASKPHVIDVHMQRQDHLEKAVKDIGASIDRYLDSLGAEELGDWKQWNEQKVAYFLREICYKNPEEYRTLESAIRHSKFNGRYFDEADEHTLEKKLGITDHLHKRFVLNARRVLEEQEQRAKREESFFTVGDDDTARGISSSVGGDDRDRAAFNFSNDNLIQMAEFFEEDLTGQSKRKLWKKVDKDMSSLIEKNEMENFLYFSIVVFIKAKYQNVRLPKKTDKKFMNRVIMPLERWLLHYKVSAHGLTFDEFDRFFPSWLREFYREHKQAEFGGTSKYQTIRVEEGLYSADSGASSDTSAHLQAKIERNKQKMGGKLGALLGNAGGGLFGSGAADSNKSKSSRSASSPAPPTEATIRADMAAGLPVTTVTESELTTISNRNEWTAESLEWEQKLGDVAHKIEKTDVATRRRIWDKFDKKKTEKLDCDKSLSRLIYSLIALYIKTKNRDAKPPKFHALLPLLNSICDDIKIMIGGNNFITQQQFEQHIAQYLQKIAAQRQQSVVAHSPSITDMMKAQKRRRTHK